MGKNNYWLRYKEYYYRHEQTGLSLDISRMKFSDNFFVSFEPKLKKIFTEMIELENGGIVNSSENRMVGHYWLRAPELAPSKEIATAISDNIEKIKKFALEAHEKFKNYLLIGIGGSALGPQLLSDALRTENAWLKPYYIDNTDPDGIDRVLNDLGSGLEETLVLVISKSGGTAETYNGMEEIRQAFSRQGKEFAKNAVAITMPDSKLDLLAASEGWLARFPLWEWVGGRTSVTSSVGLLPAALEGIDITSFLQGARAMDVETRNAEISANPAIMLAMMWFYATGGAGKKDMVILPYKDQLLYFPRYLQQLVMESIGKKLNRQGKEVNQGISVYGNKGSTDQHAYVQQLLDGINNFFLTFIEVLQDKREKNIYIKENITSGDYLHAFLLGTQQALTERGKESLTITINRLEPFSLGALIALFERAVGFYASLVNINAYDQPGVELGKKGANMIIDMLAKTLDYLKSHKGEQFLVSELAVAIGKSKEEESLFKILEYLSADINRGVKKRTGSDIFATYYYFLSE